MNYSAVAPPTQSGSGDPQSAFADALARARQIAAKINTQPGEGEPSALKRPFEGTSENQPEAKKLAALNDPIGAQLRAIADQQRSSQAAQAAAAAASQINAKLGINNSNGNSNPPSMNNFGPPGVGPGPGLGGGMVNTENFSVPDRMVGLIIGKGGEQIAAIQAETACKVQFAPDSGGLPDRPCTLTGSNDAIEQARDMIQRIIAKGQGLPDPHQMGDGQTMIEVLVPGPKVGLVIGKGGETIKHLQEKAGVKMVMIQDSNQPTHYDKPLRITGENNKCKMARDMVMELISDKDGDDFGGFDRGGGGGHGNSTEIPVPRGLVGVIIGRGGEMIKKIQADTGAKVQFRTADDGQGPDRMCTVSGSPDKVQEATNMINELIENAMNQNDQGGRGRGRGRGDDRNGPYGGGGGGGGGGGPRPGGGQNRYGDFQDETSYTVPADKCGLIIGKGGETIREINRQSGAHVELSRNQPPNPRERVFRIAGNPDQIQSAIRMMSEKAGIPPPPGGPGGHGGGPGPGQGGPGGYDQYGYGQQNPQQQGGPGGPQGYAPQGWGNAYQQWNQSNPSDPAPDKQAADANAQAWAQYYAQYYGQGQANMQQQQQQPQQPQQQQQQQPQQQQSQPQPTINPATGQPDYSQAWADYYRQQGMYQHAQAILQQAGQGQQQGQQQ